MTNSYTKQLEIMLDAYKSKYTTPLLIEVMGTPNAGKTSAIKSLYGLLKRSGVSCRTIFEAAQRIPAVISCRLFSIIGP